MPSPNAKYSPEVREQTAEFTLTSGRSSASIAEEMGVYFNTGLGRFAVAGFWPTGSATGRCPAVHTRGRGRTFGSGKHTGRLRPQRGALSRRRS